jgi:SAM-dependent methyltransferase
VTRTPSAAGLRPHTAFDLAEGFYLANALLALDRGGILPSLARPATARALARKHRVDRNLLEATLELLANRTDLIARRGDKYRVGARYDAYARFVVRQYLRAYGANAAALGRLLRKPAIAAGLIDRRAHAAAFAELATLGSLLLVDLVDQLGLDHVLDLGCGTGLLLQALADRIPGFTGWGLDVNPTMCKAARKRLAQARASARLAIFRGDSRKPQDALPASVIASVRTLTAANLANEFFARGTTAAVRWLADLKRVFPGATLLIADYYGRLNKPRRAWRREIALHDFAQIISGQGIPPPNLAAWRKIYRAAGCALVHAMEDEDASYFVHVLKL